MQEILIIQSRISDRLNIINLVVLLILLTSPAFSVLGVFVSSSIPNQRVAVAIVFLSLIRDRFIIKKDYIKIFSASIVMTFIILLRIIFYPLDSITDTSDGGLTIFLAILPAYIELFNIKKKYLFTSLSIVIYLQIAIALFQNIMMSSGLYDIALMFDNYHRFHNLEYIYPKILEGFYRTSGLGSPAYMVISIAYLNNWSEVEII